MINFKGVFMKNKTYSNKTNNIEKILNITDEKILANALKQYLNQDKTYNNKGNKNGN